MTVEHSKTIAKGAGITFIGVFISKILIYFYRVFIARFFGPEVYGQFSLGMVVLNFALIFGGLGLRLGVLRYVAFYRASEDDSRVKGTILYSLILGGVASIFIMGVLIPYSEFIANKIFHDPTLTDMLVIMLMALPFLVMFQILIFGFRSFKVLQYQVYAEKIFWNVSNIVTVLIFGFLGLGVIGLAGSYTLSIILSLFFSAYLFQKKVFPFLFSSIGAKNTGKEVLRYSIPLLLSGVFGGLIITNADIAMIGYFMDSVDVGIYNAALPTARIPGIIIAPLTVLFLPLITGLYAKNNLKDLENVYKTTIKWIFFFNIPILLFLLFYPQIIISFLFGEEYIAGSGALVFLTLGLTLRGISGIHSNILAMLEKTKIIFYISIVTVIINLPLNWILIQSRGITGAAIASFLTFSIRYLMLLYFSYRFSKMVPFSHSIFKTGISAFAAFGIFSIVFKSLLKLGFSNLIFLFLLIGYIGLYTIFLLLSKALDEGDIEILKAIERRSGIQNKKIRYFIKKLIR
jgi:O-antigen/teichoic acid export membrane protein